MGSRADVAEVLSHCRWSEDGSYLAQVLKGGFPCVVKVIRGQYQNIGQPSFSNPSLVSHLLLLSAGKQFSVAAQCVKFKNARQRVVPYGPTLAIPQNYEGHFEILSEDGRSVPCIPTVSALSRKFPDSCLVREAIKGYKADAKSDNSLVVIKQDGLHHQQQHPTYKISDKTRVIQPGEILVLVGEVSVPSGKKVSRYLRCFDSKGQTLYLNTAQKGKFSPLARQDSISGVHTTKNILGKRMPMMVRLVDGKPPVMPSFKSSSFKFVPELRLFSTLQEELIFALPLSQSSKETGSLVPLPLTVPLKFQMCRNMGEVEQMKEFCRLHEKVQNLADQAKNLIQIYDINLKKELRFDGRQWKAYAPPIFLSPSAPDILHNGNSSGGESSDSSSPQVTHGHNNDNYEVPDVQDYEDIDQIYDYVRGIKPPPSRILKEASSMERKVTTKPLAAALLTQPIILPPAKGKLGRITAMATGGIPPPIPKHRQLRPSLSLDKLIDDDRPEPPPIETIPSKQKKIVTASSGGVSVTVTASPTGLSQSDSQKNGVEYGNNGAVVVKVTSNGGSCANNKQQQIQKRSEKAKELKNNRANLSKGPPPLTHTTNVLISSSSNIPSSSSASPIHHHLGSSPTATNTSGSSGAGCGSVEKVRGKHLYVKHNGLSTDPSGGLSGSPANRILFRRSPIFDCRYKSMNDLNRSSLESGASASSSHKVRYFQHNHHGLNVSVGNGLSNLSMNLLNLTPLRGTSSSRRKGIFRPKSLTNITYDEQGGLLRSVSGTGSSGHNKKLDMVVPSHHHAIHSPPPPPIELFQKIPRSSQRSRKSHPATLYL